MKAPDKIYVEVCEDGIFAFPEPPFAESVEYIRADLVKQPVEGLEEEIKKWIDGGDITDTRYDDYDDGDIERTARHFAEWQKKQDDLEMADLLAIAHLQGMEQQKAKMMEEAVEGIAHPDDCEIWVNLVGYGYKFKDGDKVRVIIIKEDEK